MKPRALSVGAVLEHWIDTLAKFGHAKLSSSSPQLVTIEFVLPTIAYVSNDEIGALREALEMLHLAALVDVASVEDAVAGLCYHDFAEPEEEDDVDGCKCASFSAAPVSSEVYRDVEFVLTFYGTPGHFLVDAVAPSLFADGSCSRSEAFVTARNELFSGNEMPYKPIKCRVNIVSMDGGFEDEVEDDYIQHLVSFVRLLDDAVGKVDDGAVNQAQTDAWLPVQVTSINIELNDIAITRESAKAVLVIETLGIPVVCSRIGINPRALTCTAAELSAFLDALGARSLKMTVEVGHVAFGEPTQSLELDEASHHRLIETLFRGIRGARCVTSLSFGPLLAMTHSPASRKTLWSEFIACLVDESAAAQVSSLVLSPRIELLDADTALIEDAVCGERPTRIKELMLWLNESSPEAVQAFIRAVGGTATAVTLHSESHAMTSTLTVDAIVRECPQLVKLSLLSAEVDSMEVFATKKVPLRELSLHSVMVQDKQSVTAFLSKLSDPATSLAKTLRKLHVKTENNAADHLAFDVSHTTIIKHVLEKNKVIHDVEVSMSDDIPTAALAAIQSHDREVLAEPLQLAQKLAFVSATLPKQSEASEFHRNHVDEDVVRLVFAFAAERVARHVYLEF
jgi:hypothetical protein